MRTRRVGVTLMEVVVLVAVAAVAIGWLIMSKRARNREREHAIYAARTCKRNLQQIAKGMAIYLGEFGDNCFYPCPLGRGTDPNSYNGAEWLASLYWTGVIPDPGVFICPGPRDTNNDGADLGSASAPVYWPGHFGSATVSYAAMHYHSLSGLNGPGVAVRDDFPPNRPMASDDTQGPVHHGTAERGGMFILFFDGHVEFKTNTEIDLEYAVGDPDPDALLHQLRN